MWQAALPAAAGAHSGLLWLMYYIPRGTVPERGSEGIGRSYGWIFVALGLSLVFVFVSGRGITPHLEGNLPDVTITPKRGRCGATLCARVFHRLHEAVGRGGASLVCQRL